MTESLSRSPSASLPANPGHLYRMLSDAERASLQVPMPAWMEKDAFCKSFDLYPRLWVDGKVVFGYLIPKSNA